MRWSAARSRLALGVHVAACQTGGERDWGLERTATGTLPAATVYRQACNGTARQFWLTFEVLLHGIVEPLVGILGIGHYAACTWYALWVYLVLCRSRCIQQRQI